MSSGWSGGAKSIWRRAAWTGAVLGSGLCLLPFLSLHGEEFRWQQFGTAYADLSIEKTSDGDDPVEVGEQITYTLTVSNLGPTDATGVMVDDSLPEETSYVADDCGGSYNAGTNTWSWTVGNLAATASASCEVTVTVDDVGTLVNTAMVSGEQEDPQGLNDSATASNIATGVSIPGLSPTGRLALFGLLAAVSIVLLRRR